MMTGDHRSETSTADSDRAGQVVLGAPLGDEHLVDGILVGIEIAEGGQDYFVHLLGRGGDMLQSE
jgi:hypothetical protein